MEIREPKWIEDFKKGSIDGNDVIVSQKLYKQAASFYQNQDPSLQEDTLMYTVYTCPTQNEHHGNLNWGLTVMEAVTVQGECNVTRGHFHEDLQCDEIYVCIKGEGLLLLMNEKGVCIAESMKEGTIHHIDGEWAHRLVNTGHTTLEVMCCWPSKAGHDYERVEQQPFTVRIFKENDEIVIKEETR